MDIENFVYDNRYTAFFLVMLAIHWCQEKRLVTDWTALVAFSSALTGVVYLVGVRDPLDAVNALSAGLAAVLWVGVYRKRPRPAAPDGSHEAL